MGTYCSSYDVEYFLLYVCIEKGYKDKSEYNPEYIARLNCSGVWSAIDTPEAEA